MGSVFDKMHKMTNRLQETEAEKERILRKVQKEDFLLKQIDEFKEKAKQLQSMLTTKESKVQELQSVLEEREEKAKQLQGVVEQRQQ